MERVGAGRQQARGARKPHLDVEARARVLRTSRADADECEKNEDEAGGDGVARDGEDCGRCALCEDPESAREAVSAVVKNVERGAEGGATGHRGEGGASGAPVGDRRTKE